jgi:hypothetical protein
LRAGVVEEELCGKLMLFLRREEGGGGDLSSVRARLGGGWRADSCRAALALGSTCQPRRCAATPTRSAVARWWVGGDRVVGKGTSPCPAGPCVHASQLSRGLSRSAGPVARVFHTRNPPALLRGCRRCNAAKCRNKTGRNNESASYPLLVTNTQENELDRFHHWVLVASPD